jgi:hypothetical protein
MTLDNRQRIAFAVILTSVRVCHIYTYQSY